MIEPLGEATVLGHGIAFANPAITVQRSPFHTQPFWIGTGGARGINANVAPPVFLGDIIIRGGICRFTISNPDTGIPQLVKVWLVWAKPNPSKQVWTVIDQDEKDMEWDPTVEAEFGTKFGKVIFKREILMNPGVRPFTVVHRLKTQKIDQAVFNGSDNITDDELAGNQPWWCWQMVPLVTNPGASPVTTLISFNLSFSGDESEIA
jgi:hypothetical protein